MNEHINSPHYVTCRCQYCDKGIEFDSSEFEKGETRTINCPHCGMETVLFVPQPPPPILKPRRKLILPALCGMVIALLIVSFVVFALWHVKDEPWNESGTADVGDLNIKIARLYITPDFVPVDLEGGVQPTTENLHVLIQITNNSKTQKFEFDTWRGRCRLTDNFGNNYGEISFSSQPSYLNDHTTIYPGMSVNDILVFQKPVGNVSWFHLQLTAADVGGMGELRFQIPADIRYSIF